MFSNLTKSKSSPEKAAAVFAKMTADHEDAEAALIAAQAAYGEALADQAEGVAEAATVAAARRTLEEAQAKATETAAGLATAKARYTAAKEAAERAGKAAEWKSALKKNDERLAAAAKLGAAIQDFAEAYKDVMRLNSELSAALPKMPDMDAAMLRFDQIEVAVRLELLRHGVEWAIHYPFKYTITDFTAKFEDAASVVRGWDK